MFNVSGLARVRLDEAAQLAAAAFLMLAPFVLSVIGNIGRPVPVRSASAHRKIAN